MSIDTVEFESADDVALADKMKVGRQQVIAELGKRIIGQSDVIELLLLSLFDHYYNFASGSIQTADVAYFLVFSGFFLFLSLRSLQSRAWRGVV